MNVRLAEEHARVVDEVPSGEVVGPVDDDIEVAEDVERVGRCQRRRKGLEIDMRIHVVEPVARRVHLGPSEIGRELFHAVAGIALAAIVAISYAGFDITSLAIVAGALSVGIGFGLQSIVNNFVSGLILLIERPIKVGDWVVVGDQQGNVKRISVRSTEIETFDRASLIVPNSELITGRVLNWTHRNAMGRVVLKFNAGANVDPRRVIAVLNECARRHPDVLREPAPLAVFEGYTSTSTEFSLRVLLSDINKGLSVQSDLRIAAFEALRAANIDLPRGLEAVQAAS